jgi:hypothetical protein
MSRIRWAIACGVLLLALGGAGCGQGAPAGVEQIVLCSAIGPNQDPIGETDTFASTSVIYCSVRFSTLPAGTVLMARWYFQEQLIESGTTSYTVGRPAAGVIQEAIGYVTFRFEPRSPMPVGSYRVEISLNDQVIQKLPFRVVAP